MNILILMIRDLKAFENKTESIQVLSKNGDPLQGTNFPYEMQQDYIRVYLKIMYTYLLYIYVIRDFSGISAWVCEFYSTFRLSFWSHFQERGWVVYVVLASLSRVRFGECLLSEFLQSEHLVGWKVREFWGISWLRVEYLQICG